MTDFDGALALATTLLQIVRDGNLVLAIAEGVCIQLSVFSQSR